MFDLNNRASAGIQIRESRNHCALQPGTASKFIICLDGTGVLHAFDSAVPCSLAELPCDTVGKMKLISSLPGLIGHADIQSNKAVPALSRFYTLGGAYLFVPMLPDGGKKEVHVFGASSLGELTAEAISRCLNSPDYTLLIGEGVSKRQSLLTALQVREAQSLLPEVFQRVRASTG